MEPLRATCTTKVKANSVKQEFEKQEELKRSAMRAVAALLNVPDAGELHLYFAFDIFHSHFLHDALFISEFPNFRHDETFCYNNLCPKVLFYSLFLKIFNISGVFFPQSKNGCQLRLAN